jgi:hypothetical protein
MSIVVAKAHAAQVPSTQGVDPATTNAAKVSHAVGAKAGSHEALGKVSAKAGMKAGAKTAGIA